MPRISIIIPVFNAERHLGACLDSVIGQTCGDFEAICVDDASSDGSLALLQSYAERDGRIRVMANAENRGPGQSRNDAIGAARGDYLAFLDSDDWIDPRLFEKAGEAIERTDPDVVIWDAWMYNERMGARRPSDCVSAGRFDAEVFSWQDNPDWIFQSFQNWPWNKMFRADFIRNARIRFQDIARTEDLMFACPALIKARRMTCINEPLTYYRTGRPGSAMDTKDSHPLDFFRAFASLKEFLEAEGVYDKTRRSFDNWALGSTLYNLDTLHTPEAFHEVFSFMGKQGLSELGIEDAPDGYYYNGFWPRALRLIAEGDESRYLLARLHQSTAAAEDEATSRFAEAERAGDELARMSEHARNLQAQIDYLHQIHDSLAEEYESLAARHESIMNAAEQKIGQAVCRFPRFVQRQMLKDRQGAR